MDMFYGLGAECVGLVDIWREKEEMSLRVWLPFTDGTLKQQGLNNASATVGGTVNLTNAGKLGKCATIGTAAGGITLPASTMTSFTECSVAFWIKIISWNTSYATFFQAGLGSTPWNNYIFGILRNNQNSNLCFTLTNSSGSSSQASYITSNLNTGQWYHLVFTYKAGTICTYIDGVLDKTYNTSYVPNFAGITNISIGRSTNNSNYQTNCNLNDFRIYDHCLSPMEVKQLSQGLVLHYPLSNKYIESTSNIITSLKAGGRTNVIDGDKIQNTGESSDTYFYLMSPGLVAGEIYTLSYYCQGLPSSDLDGRFGVGAQSPTQPEHCGYITIQNGWNKLTFTCPESLNGNTQLILDDYSATWRTNVVTFSNFQLEHNNYKTGTQSINTWCGAKLTANTIIGSDGAISSSSGWYTTDYIPITPNKSYKLTGLSKGGSGTYIALFNSSKTLQRTLLITANQDVFFTASTNEYFLRTSIRNLAYELTTTAKLIYLDSIEYDCSGYCNNGEIHDTTITYSSDTPKYNFSTKNNQANNSSNYPLKGNLILNDIDKITIAMWGKPVINGYQDSGFISTSAVSSPVDYQQTVLNHYDSRFACCNTSGTVVTLSVGGQFTLNEWHHYAFVYDGSKIYFYKDGVLKTSANQSGKLKPITGIFPFYSRAGGTDRTTSGNMSDLRVYTTALSADDVKSLYQNSAYIDSSGNVYGAIHSEV